MICCMNSTLISYSSLELELIQERNHKYCSTLNKGTTIDEIGDVAMNKEQQPTFLSLFLVPSLSAGIE